MCIRDSPRSSGVQRGARQGGLNDKAFSSLRTRVAMNKKAVLQESVRHHARSAKRLPYINAKQRRSGHPVRLQEVWHAAWIPACAGITTERTLYSVLEEQTRHCRKNGEQWTLSRGAEHD